MITSRIATAQGHHRGDWNRGATSMQSPYRRTSLMSVPLKVRLTTGLQDSQMWEAAELAMRTSLRTAQRPMAAAAPTVAHGISITGCQPKPRTLPKSQNARVGTTKKAPMWTH